MQSGSWRVGPPPVLSIIECGCPVNYFGVHLNKARNKTLSIKFNIVVVKIKNC